MSNVGTSDLFLTFLPEMCGSLTREIYGVIRVLPSDKLKVATQLI